MEILVDDALFWLNEAERYLDMIVDIDPYQEIFETYNPDVQLKVEQNEKAKTGVAGSLKKAIEAIKRMCRNLIDSIKDFFARRNLDATEKKAYEDFKAACKKNPELKDKKVSVKDFRKFNEEYNKILEEAKKADQALAENRVCDTEAVFGRIADFTKGVASAAAVSVGCDAALNIASSSREIAQDIYASLQYDQNLYNKIENAIGKKEAKRFENQMKSLGKRLSLQRAIMKMKGTYSKSVDQALDKTFTNVKELISGTVGTVGAVKDSNYDPNINVTGNAIQRAGNTAKVVGSVLKNGEVGTVGKAALKTDIPRRLLGNKEIKAGIKEISATSKKSTKEARSAYKMQKRDQRRRERYARHWKTHDQSKLDAILGLNDPDSKIGRHIG